MLVCHCRGVTDRQIKRLVKDGLCTTREVARATGAGMRCGGCRANVRQVVAEAVDAQEKQFEASRRSLTLPLAIPVEG